MKSICYETKDEGIKDTYRLYYYGTEVFRKSKYIDGNHESSVYIELKQDDPFLSNKKKSIHLSPIFTHFYEENSKFTEAGNYFYKKCPIFDINGDIIGELLSNEKKIYPSVQYIEKIKIIKHNGKTYKYVETVYKNSKSAETSEEINITIYDGNTTDELGHYVYNNINGAEILYEIDTEGSKTTKNDENGLYQYDENNDECNIKDHLGKSNIFFMKNKILSYLPFVIELDLSEVLCDELKEAFLNISKATTTQNKKYAKNKV